MGAYVCLTCGTSACSRRAVPAGLLPPAGHATDTQLLATHRGRDPVKVRAIDFVISHVTDVKEAVRFYRDTLGVEGSFIRDDHFSGDGATDTWTEFDTKPVTLAVVRWEQEAGRPGIALAVDDVYSAVEELRSKGVTVVMEPVDAGSCDMAWIRDPWGNLLCIHRRKDGSCG